MLLAGDRAPDAPVRRAAGQSSRLFELFKGPHWTLLGYETARSPMVTLPGLRTHMVGQGGDLSDEGGHFYDAYGLSPGEWALIRPDGYVGAVIAQGDADALAPYLADVGLDRRCIVNEGEHHVES